MRPLRLRSRGRGAALRVSLGDESCGAAALLHRLLGAPADDDCALQGALLDLAGRVGGSAAFTLLQDCEEPPCARCGARVAAFAAARPDVAVFAVADADDAPPNLWRLERARDAAALAARRDALAGCAGGCAGVQIAHAFQGHPLLSVAAAAALPRPPPGGRRLLSEDDSELRRWMPRDELADEQQYRADERLRAASERLSAAEVDSQLQAAWLRGGAAANTGGGGGVQQQPPVRVVRAAEGRHVGGPAAAAWNDAVEAHSSAAVVQEEAPRDVSALTWLDAVDLDLSRPPPPSPPPPPLPTALEAPEPHYDYGDGGRATPNPTDDDGAAAAAAHQKALGRLLIAAQRTLLLLPAAELLGMALNDAALPASISRELRAALPYTDRESEERWLQEAVAAVGEAS